MEDYPAAGIELAMAGVIGPVCDILFKSELVKVLGPEGVFVHCSDAVDYYDRKWTAEKGQDPKKVTLPRADAAFQTNFSEPGS